MPTENFIAAASSPPRLTSANSALLKDAGIFVHSFQPQPALRGTFKKSATAPNCLAISQSHVFAAQSEKALVHIYSREKGNHEATIPFPERIHSLALACDDTVLVLGTASGSILLWETCTGRLLSTPTSHLQPVNVVAVDMKSNFILSGSRDSSIHVWSVLDLLSFPSASAVLTDETAEPRYTLSDHRNAITAIQVGHSATPVNIAVSASEDQTCIIWNYQSGERLRTFLLPSIALCLALDPADRAFYAGYKDGSVQLVSFYDTASTTSVHDASHASTPLQPSSKHRHFPQPSSDSTSGANSTDVETDPALSISVSYDGTVFLTGHASGKINSWSITTSGSASSSLLAEYLGSPITFIQFQPPEDWPSSRPPSFKTTSISKPKPHEHFSGAQGQFNGSYTFGAQFSAATEADSDTRRRKRRRGTRLTGFDDALAEPLFPDDMLAASVAELVNWNNGTRAAASASKESNGSVNGGMGSFDGAQDYVTFDDGAVDGGKEIATAQIAASEERIAHLEKQVSHLRSLQETSHRHVGELVKENEAMRRREERARQRRERKIQARFTETNVVRYSDGVRGERSVDEPANGSKPAARLPVEVDQQQDSDEEGLSSAVSGSESDADIAL